MDIDVFMRRHRSALAHALSLTGNFILFAYCDVSYSLISDIRRIYGQKIHNNLRRNQSELPRPIKMLIRRIGRGVPINDE